MILYLKNYFLKRKRSISNIVFKWFIIIRYKCIEIKHDEDEKIGILDIKATLNNNTYIDIEMQMGDEKNVVKRSTYYAAKMMSDQLQNGEKYKEIKPVIVIFIMNFNYFPHSKHLWN